MSLSTPILTLICCACAVPHGQRGRECGQTQETFHSRSSFLSMLLACAGSGDVQTPR